MPRLRRTESVDWLKAMILERKKSLHYTNGQCANVLGVSRSKFNTLINKPTDEWKLKDLKALCYHMGIRLEEFRDAIEYPGKEDK